MTDFNIEKYSSRIMNSENIQIDKFEKNQYKKIQAIVNDECQRCFSRELGVVYNKKYCRNCVNFGRIDESSELVIFKRIKEYSNCKNCLRWKGQLSKLQQSVSDELKENFLKYDEHLLWAVTGAGKTEILFATIEEALSGRLRVAIISPRVDVCEELYPRFKNAFDLDISLMHGRKEDELQDTQLVIATVHQMIKFRSAFDLIIVDEVDSYPLFGNQWLQDIFFRALTKEGKIIYLSATPPKEIMKKVKKIYYLPQRFHGKPLPVPKAVMNSSKKKIMEHIKSLGKSNQRFLLFFPSIRELNEFCEAIGENEINFEYKKVSSKNDQRLKIIQDFRDNKLFALFTTTILERGVTFKDIDVLIYGSDDPNFSKEVLIQIAGRAGRQLEHYDNNVTFYYFVYNRQVKEAITEIKKLNRLAEKLK